MTLESEILLIAAARISADETKAGDIHVIIQGNGESNNRHPRQYLVGGGEVAPVDSVADPTGQLPSAAERARLHLTYASEDVFLGLAHK